HRGRAVVTRGEHARVRDLPVARRGDPFRGAGPGTALTVPLTAPRGLCNRGTMTAVNHAYYHRAPKRRRDETQPPAPIFPPPLRGRPPGPGPARSPHRAARSVQPVDHDRVQPRLLPSGTQAQA